MNIVDIIRERSESQSHAPLDNGLDRGKRMLRGIFRQHYYLIGASPGTGKTTFADQLFLLSPYDRNLKINWIYFSFELNKDIKQMQWMSYFAKRKYDFDIEVPKIAGFSGKKLSNKEIDIAQMVYDNFLGDLMDSITLYTVPMTPDEIAAKLLSFMKSKGKVEYDEDGKPIGFEPFDKSEITICIIDHVSYINSGKHGSLKFAIDELSETLVFFRNIFGITPVVVQQFNTEIQSIDRQRYNVAAIEPMQTDFGDSRYTFRDADIVMGLIKPSEYKIKSWYGYDLTGKMKESVFCCVIKNRYMREKGIIPLIRGTAPFFYELPRNDDQEALKRFIDTLA